MSVVIALFLFALAAFAIWRWVAPIRQPAWRAKRIYWIVLGALVLLWLLALTGLFGPPAESLVHDPLLNR